MSNLSALRQMLLTDTAALDPIAALLAKPANPGEAGHNSGLGAIVDDVNAKIEALDDPNDVTAMLETFRELAETGGTLQRQASLKRWLAVAKAAVKLAINVDDDSNADALLASWKATGATLTVYRSRLRTFVEAQKLYVLDKIVTDTVSVYQGGDSLEVAVGKALSLAKQQARDAKKAGDKTAPKMLAPEPDAIAAKLTPKVKDAATKEAEKAKREQAQLEAGKPENILKAAKEGLRGKIRNTQKAELLAAFKAMLDEIAPDTPTDKSELKTKKGK